MKVTVRNYFMESMDEPIWMVIFAKLIVIGDKIIKITKYAPSTNRESIHFIKNSVANYPPTKLRIHSSLLIAKQVYQEDGFPC